MNKTEDATWPIDGWPWPWDTSATTDVTYMFEGDQGVVWVSHFGGPWLAYKDVIESEDIDELEDEVRSNPRHDYDMPDMSARRVLAEAGGTGSGSVVCGYYL